MKRLAALYGGSFPERRVMDQPKYRRWLAEVIYLLDLPETDLGRFDGLLVPEGLHHLRLQAAAPQIGAFLDCGGTVLLFGDQPLAWLPGLDWQFGEARRPGPGDLVAQQRGHSFHRHLSLDDVWHHHGVFHPPAGAEVLLATANGDAVLYLDQSSTPGTLLVTSLDLLVHAGTSGNPISERFLDRFLPWVVEDLL
jgi:hypothetical protein